MISVSHASPILFLGALGLISGCSSGAHHNSASHTPAEHSSSSHDATPGDAAPGADAKACGPQAPRDITQTAGTNSVPVPGGDTPTLCNVHLHKPLEHSGFANKPAPSGSAGEPVCKNVDVGDEVEFHWVYTNCAANDPPIKGLANCVCDREDLVLRVYAQAYVVSDTGLAPTQPTAGTVRYAGSTTGPSYTDRICSPAKVNWEVHPEMQLVDKAKLGAWCNDNPWPDEDHPHEARAVVTNPEWLSPM